MDSQQTGPNHHCNNHFHSKAPGTAAQLLLFARNFLKYPNMVGWMLPSSPFVVQQVLKQINWPEAKVIVEYGPGLGTFTTQLLRQMRPDARLVALETNPEFVRFLNHSVRDPRLQLIHESAAEVDRVL